MRWVDEYLAMVLGLVSKKVPFWGLIWREF
jgi:hypothetical protein